MSAARSDGQCMRRPSTSGKPELERSSVQSAHSTFWAALPFRSRPNSSCLVGHFPFLSALAGVHLIGNRHYFRPYAWLDRGDENRDDKGGHALRKRPWGREGPGSSRMPHEPFCPSRAVCSGKSSATSTRRRSLKN